MGDSILERTPVYHGLIPAGPAAPLFESAEIFRVFYCLRHAKKSQEIPIRLRRTLDVKFGQTGARFLSREAAEADLMSKQTTITIESKSLLILRSRSSTQAWCPLC